MKGTDQQKTLSKLPSAFNINQLIPRDIIILSTGQYRFGQVKILYERTNIICFSPSEQLEKLVSGFPTIFSDYCLQYFLITRILKQQITI